MNDLGLKFPPLEHSLDAIDHLLIVKAQQVPQELASQGGERVRSIRDRVWFKVKASVYRGAVTELNRTAEHPPEIMQASAWWWLGAAGRRREDSGTDFYRSLAEEVQREGRGTGGTSSTHLLPTDVDFRRLQAELAVRVTVEIGRVVRRLVAGAIKTGKVGVTTLSNHQISAFVKARDGEAYLAVVAEGFTDPRVLAVILSSVPRLTSDDWLPEPEGAFAIQPRPGQIIYSTIIPADCQIEIMDEFPDDELLEG